MQSFAPPGRGVDLTSFRTFAHERFLSEREAASFLGGPAGLEAVLGPEEFSRALRISGFRSNPDALFAQLSGGHGTVTVRELLNAVGPFPDSQSTAPPSRTASPLLRRDVSEKRLPVDSRPAREVIDVGTPDSRAGASLNPGVALLSNGRNLLASTPLSGARGASPAASNMGRSALGELWQAEEMSELEARWASRLDKERQIWSAKIDELADAVRRCEGDFANQVRRSSDSSDGLDRLVGDLREEVAAQRSDCLQLASRQEELARSLQEESRQRQRECAQLAGLDSEQQATLKEDVRSAVTRVGRTEEACLALQEELREEGRRRQAASAAAEGESANLRRDLIEDVRRLRDEFGRSQAEVTKAVSAMESACDGIQRELREEILQRQGEVLGLASKMEDAVVAWRGDLQEEIRQRKTEASNLLANLEDALREETRHREIQAAEFKTIIDASKAALQGELRDEARQRDADFANLVARVEEARASLTSVRVNLEAEMRDDARQRELEFQQTLFRAEEMRKRLESEIVEEHNRREEEMTKQLSRLNEETVKRESEFQQVENELKTEAAHNKEALAALAAALRSSKDDLKAQSSRLEDLSSLLQNLLDEEVRAREAAVAREAAERSLAMEQLEGRRSAFLNEERKERAEQEQQILGKVNAVQHELNFEKAKTAAASRELSSAISQVRDSLATETARRQEQGQLLADIEVRLQQSSEELRNDLAEERSKRTAAETRLAEDAARMATSLKEEVATVLQKEIGDAEKAQAQILQLESLLNDEKKVREQADADEGRVREEADASLARMLREVVNDERLERERAARWQATEKSERQEAELTTSKKLMELDDKISTAQREERSDRERLEARNDSLSKQLESEASARVIATETLQRRLDEENAARVSMERLIVACEKAIEDHVLKVEEDTLRRRDEDQIMLDRRLTDTHLALQEVRSFAEACDIEAQKQLRKVAEALSAEETRRIREEQSLLEQLEEARRRISAESASRHNEAQRTDARLLNFEEMLQRSSELRAELRELLDDERTCREKDVASLDRRLQAEAQAREASDLRESTRREDSERWTQEVERRAAEARAEIREMVMRETEAREKATAQLDSRIADEVSIRQSALLKEATSREDHEQRLARVIEETQGALRREAEARSRNETRLEEEWQRERASRAKGEEELRQTCLQTLREGQREWRLENEERREAVREVSSQLGQLQSTVHENALANADRDKRLSSAIEAVQATNEETRKECMVAFDRFTLRLEEEAAARAAGSKATENAITKIRMDILDEARQREVGVSALSESLGLDRSKAETARQREHALFEERLSKMEKERHRDREHQETEHRQLTENVLTATEAFREECTRFQMTTEKEKQERIVLRESLAHECDQLRRDCDTLRRSCAEVAEKATLLSRDQEATKQEQQALATRLERKLETDQLRSQEVDAQVAGLTARCEEVRKAARDEVLMRRQAIASEHVDERVKIDGLREDLSLKLDERARELRLEISEVRASGQADIASTRDTLKVLTAEVRASNVSQEHAQRSSRELQGGIDLVRESVATAQREIELIQKDIQAVSGRFASEQEDLRERIAREAKLREVSIGQVRLCSAVTDAHEKAGEEDINQQRHQTLQLRREFQVLKEQVEKLEKQYRDVNVNLREVEGSVADASNQRLTLQAELDVLRKEPGARFDLLGKELREEIRLVQETVTLLKVSQSTSAAVPSQEIREIQERLASLQERLTQSEIRQRTAEDRTVGMLEEIMSGLTTPS